MFSGPQLEAPSLTRRLTLFKLQDEVIQYLDSCLPKRLERTLSTPVASSIVAILKAHEAEGSTLFTRRVGVDSSAQDNGTY